MSVSQEDVNKLNLIKEHIIEFLIPPQENELVSIYNLLHKENDEYSVREIQQIARFFYYDLELRNKGVIEKRDLLKKIHSALEEKAYFEYENLEKIKIEYQIEIQKPQEFFWDMGLKKIVSIIQRHYNTPFEVCD